MNLSLSPCSFPWWLWRWPEWSWYERTAWRTDERSKVRPWTQGDWRSFAEDV